MAAPAAAPFEQAGRTLHGEKAEAAEQQLKQQVIERLKQGPGQAAREEAAPTRRGPPPTRWTLPTIRASVGLLQGMSLSGVWRLLDRWGLSLRSALVQQFSPDPQYLSKLATLEQCLRETVQNPRRVVCLFVDQMGYTRWPEPGPDWGPQAPAEAPLADRRRSGNGLWRIMGALNAVSGRVHYLDNYIVGRQVVIQMYDLLVHRYRRAERIYVVQDNWSIHRHPDVLEALQAWPKVVPVGLPTYAPWLNPIEKLWRWLRQDVLKLHRLAHDFAALRERVNQFLGQFARGSQRLLHYVGLKGGGRLARCLQPLGP